MSIFARRSRLAYIMVSSICWPAYAQTNLQHVSNNTALQATSTVTLQQIVRDGFSMPGDSPPVTFVASASACSLNSGAGDGVSQVPSANGKCWLGSITVPDIRMAGAATTASSSVNATALINTVNAAGTAYVPLGQYPTNIGSSLMPAPLNGIGQIGDSMGNRRAPKFDLINQAPSALGIYSSPDTAFNGDWRHGGGEEYRIYGTATLGQPSTGYQFTPEASPHYLSVYNASGWNQSTSGNDGRTAAVGHRIQSYQAGQGDLINFSGTCFVTGQRAGATNFLANPACSLFAGDAFAGQDGVYLNPIEINLNDQGRDVAGIGAVFNLLRTNTTGNLGTMWAGVRLQQSGSGAVDTAWSATGKYRFGLDFSGATFGTDQAVLTLTRGQRIYGNTANSDPNLRFPTALGGDWISNEATVQGWNFVVGGSSQFQINASQVTALQPVAALAFTGSLGNSAVTLAGSSSVGSGASVACATGHSCDQVSGTYTLNTGSGSLSLGPVFTLTFSVARGHVPNCVINLQRNGVFPTPLLVAKTMATAGLTFYPGAPLAASSSYDLDYFCGGS
ncbi:hypothetical protein NDN01_01840 [Sphingomonas sp. QA11]|uniref:hypothetical protein n=1 Tax=Sphingomonas sp. QA11 TaxID=2950605 RepID=UPI00234B7AA9|nr:hypothetical protein [Sphingomonas sp. QA11]WCM27699.1 hypothetical protein NDN01_01840 [Sphingomonas sp. QA11]